MSLIPVIIIVHMVLTISPSIALPTFHRIVRSDLIQNPATVALHVQHFRDIARNLGIPEDTSTIIRDFLTRSLIQLEQIAENNNPSVFNRTFSGNAVVINGSTLNRSSGFYSFLDRIRESKKSDQPVLISDNWNELKNHINDAYTRDTVIETFEYAVHSMNIGPNKLLAQTHWTRVKQVGNGDPDVRKGSEQFVVNLGEGASDPYNVFDANQEHTDSKPDNAILGPYNFGTQGPSYKESYVVQKSAPNGPTIYITHVYINPVTNVPSENIGIHKDFVPKDTPEVAQLKAQHLALKENLERIAYRLLKQT